MTPEARRPGQPVRLSWDRAPESDLDPADLRLATLVGARERGAPVIPPGGRLYWGDNLAVMASLLPEFEGRVGLIYVDPPFLTGKAYRARVGRGEDSRRPKGWRTAAGYDDAWTDTSAYLDMLYRRLELLYRLLSPRGTLYLHLDWHASAYARLLLDEIFGPDRFLNEIVWCYHGPSPIRTAFKRKHDTLLAYTKTREYTFNADAVRVAYDPSTVRTFASSPKAGFGKVPDLGRGKVPEDWWYFPVVARLHKERTGFPTQKPEALLERIILASSQPGDWVGDLFCGSGTTPCVARRHGRRWLACDASPLALQTTYRRLVLQGDRDPFEVWHSQEMPLNLVPEVKVTLDGRRARLEFEALQGSMPSSLPFPDSVALWEVDWEFDGQVFRSSTQLVRAWRGGDIGLTTSHVYTHPGPRQIAVRAQDGHGQVGQSSHAITLP
jgi:DNA modification methylase